MVTAIHAMIKTTTLPKSRVYSSILTNKSSIFRSPQAHYGSSASIYVQSKFRAGSEIVSAPRWTVKRRSLHSKKEPVHDWKGNCNEILFESIPSDTRLDSFHRNQSHLLDIALKDLWTSSAPETRGLVETESVDLGRHLIYFNIPICLDNLMPDGTDTRFVPGPPACWPVRLWAGGSIKLHTQQPPRLSDERYKMVEAVSKVRVLGKQEPEKAFVTVTKDFMATDQKHHLPQVDTEEQNVTPPRPAGTTDNPSRDMVLFTEEYTLCFLRNRVNAMSKDSGIRPPSNPQFTQTILPTKDLLFCWSALTYNAHWIHIDSLFAQQEYGIKDLLVHGPLTVMLMLEYLRRLLIPASTLRPSRAKAVIRSISYRNLVPLYVNEPFTICAAPLSTVSPGAERVSEKWSIWIQTGKADDKSPRLAVKAIAFVDRFL